MKRTTLLTVLVMVGCQKPPEKKFDSPELIATKLVVDDLEKENERLTKRVEELKDVIKDLEGKIKTQKKNRDPTEKECRALLRPFDQCGWKCLGNTSTISRCVTSCNHFIRNKKTQWCLHMWGPGFG